VPDEEPKTYMGMTMRIQHTVIRPPACRTGHYDGVPGTKEDRYWLYVSSDSADEKYCGVSKPDNSSSEDYASRECTYDIETSGDVAQTSERSTCAMSVSCGQSWSALRHRLENTL
jgi:hypothetical protein